MCGLLGMIARTNGGFLHADLKAFEQMLVTNTIRGADSVGCFTKFGNGDVRAIKHGSHPFNLFKTSEWEEFKRSTIQRGKFLIGHNRAATIGGVSTDNAHPFVEDHIILVHNGTLREQKNLTTKTSAVDSNAIAHALVEEERDPRHVLDRINGAFALIWYDSKQDKLFAARNEERPLVMLESDRHWILSSEAWIAAYPAMKNGLKIEKSIQIPENVLFEFGAKGEYKEHPFNNSSQKGTQVAYHYKSREVDDTETDPPFDVGSEDTPETKRLREQLAQRVLSKADQLTTPKNLKRKRILALAQRANDLSKTAKRNEETRSVACALTQPKGTTASVSPAGRLTDEDTDRMRMSGITVIEPDFPIGELQVFKIHQMKILTNDRTQVIGTIMTPGKGMVDCIGYLPFDVTPAKSKDWYSFMAKGKVQFVTNSTNGGMTVHLKEVDVATLTEFQSGPGVIMYWDYAVNECTCIKCARKVDPWERMYTSIRSKGLVQVPRHNKPTNSLEVTCADCIIKAMKKGEHRDKFEDTFNRARDAIAKARAASHANRDVALQNREQLGKKPGSGPANLVLLPGQTTIH